MAATHLTARYCAVAKPKIGANGKPVQTAFPDDDPTGLELRVSAEGRKVWTFRYRTLEGRQRRLTLGVFIPDDDEDRQTGTEKREAWPRPLTLKAARKKARMARAVVEDGGDPATKRRKDKEAARAQTIRTFDDLANAYLGACTSGEWKPKGRPKRERTIKDETNILRRYVRPAFGKSAVEEVSRATVKRMLQGLISRGIGAQTNRAHAVVRQVYAYAIAEERVQVNPATGFAKHATETPRVRVISDAELKALWGVITSPEGVSIAEEGAEPRPLYLSRPVAIALSLSALLLQRRGEICGLRRAELDLENRTWLIPAERMKGGKAHLVPLTIEAVKLIEEALRLADFGREKPSPCVFPGRRDPAKPMRPDSLSHALADVAKAAGVEGVTVHDLRRTGAFVMASERLGVLPFVVSKVLGHSGDTGGAAAVTLRHYAVNDFMGEKRAALAAWEDELLAVVGAQPRNRKMQVISGGRP